MNEGSHFLDQKYRGLRTSQPVEHEKARKKRSGEKVSEKPVEKIADFLSVLERTHLGHNDNPLVFDRIKNYYHKEHVIKPEDIPQHYWNQQAGIMIREGRGADMAQAGVEKETFVDKDGKEHTNYHFPEDLREQKIEILRNNQERSLDLWVNYLTSDDALYPMWAKYWAFQSVLGMGKFEKIQIEGEEDEQRLGKARFQKRTKDTVSSFPYLNPRALAQTIGIMSERIAEKQKPKKERQPIKNVSAQLADPEFQKLLSTESFSKLYAQFLFEMPEYSTEGLEETRGEWKKYPQGSDPKKLVESLESYPLEWCTVNLGTAEEQLKGGDFYVYYSYDEGGNSKIPRIAIRMLGQKIAEPPRGIAPDQSIDPYIGPVLEKKMGAFGQEGELYKKRAGDMEILTQIEEKTKAGIFNQQEDQNFINHLKVLYEIDRSMQGFGFRKDPRIRELREQRNPEEDMLIIFNCTPEEIARAFEQITPDTKAYIGPLTKNIFHKLPQDLEHIYIEFPEQKIRKTEIEIGEKSKEELIKELLEADIKTPKEALDMIKCSDFKTLKIRKNVTLVRLSVKNLGFEKNTAIDDIYQRAQELGLTLSPAEVGPHYRLEYRDQPIGEWVTVGMKQIGGLSVFSVGRSSGRECLYNQVTNSTWHPIREFVFCLCKNES
ncbi:hypothetical protein KKH43_04770 [Patescibacteria group bacterium]|nr:hypothetical protein [Patescibacteria group bacterium]